MSTNARVGILRTTHHPMDEERYGKSAAWNQQVESIYIHWDGYPEWTGKRLLEAWSGTKMVEQLVKLGDLSILGNVIGSKHDFDTHDPRGEDCLAYGRDRGEEDVSSITHAIDDWPDYGQEFEYLWDGDAWMYRDTYDGGGKGWAPLTMEVVTV